MTKRKNKLGQGMSVWLTIVGLIGLGVVVALLLKGKDVRLMNPKGLIAGEQLRLMMGSMLLMLEIAIPTLFVLYFFAWKYRESHASSTYDAEIRHGKLFVFSMWAVPTIMMLLLAYIMWPATHRLQPQKNIDPAVKPLKIQVVAMSWKWVFIYPEQKIATVNFVQVPVGTPVQFELSADEAPMSSFWIPHLGGQLYAMTGHVNRLNLMAEEPGDYPGSSAEINGKGFAGMKFIARASSIGDFERWVQELKQSSNVLDASEYTKLLAPSENNPAAFYTTTGSNLYEAMLLKYAGSHGQGTTKHEAGHE